MIKFLAMVDGNKTYIMTVVGGIFALIHFLVIGDWSMASFMQLGQDASFCAMFAALRHGVAKLGNLGVVTT